MKALLSIFFVSTLLFVKGQDSTKVTFQFANESKFEIRIDSNRISTSNSFKLEVGSHKIEIWNGCMEIITDTIFVSKDVPRVYQYQVKMTEAYKIYKSERSLYRSNMFGRTILPATLFSAGCVLSGIFMKRIVGVKDEMLQLNTDYYTSTNVDFLKLYQSKFNGLEEVYREYRLKAVLFSGLAVSAGILEFFGIRSFTRKFSKPKLDCLVSPFTGHDYSLEFKFGLTQSTLALNF